MNTKEVTTFTNSIQKFFGLKPTGDELNLSVLNSQLKAMDYTTATQAYIQMAKGTHNVFSLNQALTTFRDYYNIASDKRAAETKAQNDKKNLQYTAFADTYKPTTYTPQPIKPDRVRSAEARAFVVFMQLVRYEYLDKNIFGEVKLFGPSTGFGKVRLMLTDYCRGKEVIDFEETAKAIMNFLNPKPIIVIQETSPEAVQERVLETAHKESMQLSSIVSLENAFEF
jgi:hypothetical protein